MAWIASVLAFSILECRAHVGGMMPATIERAWTRDALATPGVRHYHTYVPNLTRRDGAALAAVLDGSLGPAAP